MTQTIFKKKKKELKDLDRNEIIIKWGDEIIFHANHLGEVSRDSFDPAIFFSESSNIPKEVLEIRNHVIASLGDTKGDVNSIVNELISYLGGVKNHLLSHGYIKDPVVTERFWRIDDEGKSMKELGGHSKYKAYKQKKFDAEISDQNAKIYWWKREIWKWAIAAALGYV